MADDLLAQQNPLYAQILASQIGQGQQGIALPQTLQARLASALAQQKEGLDMSPIRSGWQGLARMANAALGGYGQYQAEQAAAGIPRMTGDMTGTWAIDQLGRRIPGSFQPHTFNAPQEIGGNKVNTFYRGTEGGAPEEISGQGNAGAPPGVQGIRPAAPIPPPGGSGGAPVFAPNGTLQGNLTGNQGQPPVSLTTQKLIDYGTRVAAEKKRAEEGASLDAKYYDQRHRGQVGLAEIAAQQKLNLHAAMEVADMPNFTPGFGSPIAQTYQRALAQFGINPNSAAPNEVFRMVSAKILQDQISGMKSMSSDVGEQAGRIFAPMIAMEEKASITDQDSVPGIKAKLNFMDKTGDLFMKWGRMADAYKAAHGQLDANFDSLMRDEVAKARVSMSDLLPKPEPAGVPTATGPNGQKIYFRNGAWGQ